MGDNRLLNPAGPRALSTTDARQDNAVVAGLYMRPNLDSDGSIPAKGLLYECPDIWPSGTQPINDYNTKLADQNDRTYGYGVDSSADVVLNSDNYIYVRVKNGATDPRRAFLRLYYAPSGILQWPQKWRGNVLRTDEGADHVNLVDVPPGTVAVGDRPFVWPYVPEPPVGQHYCLFAQINDAANGNPFPPDSTNPLDLAALINKNLGWGWRNVAVVEHDAAGFHDEQTLDVAATVDDTYTYDAAVQVWGYTGWHVSFTCSQNDADGQQIALAKTRVTQDGGKYGVPNFRLPPGFTSVVSIYLYNDDKVPMGANPKVKLVSHYLPDGDFVKAATLAGLVDWDETRDRARWTNDTTPTPAVLIGSFTYRFTT